MSSDLSISIKEIPSSMGYWFVRTNDGTYFETFTKNDFIAIGWNLISLEDLNKSDKELRDKIIRIEKFDSTKKGTTGKVTSIINKLKNFRNLKQGDRIIVPSNSSSRLAFGIVEDSVVYTDVNESHDCTFHKRRKVNWVTIKNMTELDPNFFQIKISRHSISNIKQHSVFIDKVYDSLFIKNNQTHFVIDIKTKSDINLKSLIELMSLIQKLVENINRELGYDESADDISVRLNLQSPGLIEIIKPIGKPLRIAVLAISLQSCETAGLAIPVKDSNVSSTLSANIDTINRINEVLFDDLGADEKKIRGISNGDN